MMIHEITALAGAHKKARRIGRGEGSGRGKTSGRGHKGAGSRAGYSQRPQFEGGQMPLFRRIAKRGFTNVQFKTQFWIVNIGDIAAHPMFAKGGEVNAQRLVEAGLIRDTSRPLKILGDMRGKEGGLKVRLSISADRVTDSVRKMITDAGGSVAETGTRRDKVRGVDRNSEDRAPKNLTRKLNRGKKRAKPAAAAGSAEGEAASE